jgi:DNA-directed RNA polymerase subunit H (RpoH/RPB5)
MTDTKITENIYTFLAARGYKVLHANDRIITTDKCVVVIEQEIKVNLQYMKTLIMHCIITNTDHCIVMYAGTFTTNVRSVIRDCAQVRVELFPLTMFVFVLVDHFLVPKHRRINITEMEALGIRQFDHDKLPVLLETDPICRYHDFRQGDFVRIDRKDGSWCIRQVRKKCKS